MSVSPVPEADSRPSVPPRHLRLDGHQLVLGDLQAVVSRHLLARHHRDGLAGTQRALVICRHRAEGVAVLQRDPAQPILVGLALELRDELRPRLPEMRVSPVTPGSRPIARSAFTAGTERLRSVRDDDVARNQRTTDFPRPTSIAEALLPAQSMLKGCSTEIPRNRDRRVCNRFSLR